MSLPGMFVTGTDTGVGKTYVASGIAASLTRRGRRVGVLKPVATGAAREGGRLYSEDTQRLIEAIGGGVPPELVTPFLFEEPLAPPVAARREGTRLEQAATFRTIVELIRWWSERVEALIVEGVGGLLCPLTEGTTVADLAVALDYPVLIVAQRRLGTLNHTLMTWEAADRRGLRVGGLVLNQAEPGEETVADRTNAEELSHRLPGVPVLLDLAYSASGSLGTIDSVDWFERMKRPRLAPASDPSGVGG